MKRLLILLFAGSTLFSCGDDDSGSNSTLKPASIKIGNDEPILIAYDDKDRIQSVNTEGIVSVFTYNDQNRVQKVTTGADFYEFTYDQDGKYTSMVEDGGDVMAFTHIGNNQYTVNGTTIGFEGNGDWKMYDVYSFSYSNKKGPFANVKHFNPLALMLVNGQMLYIASKKRRVSISVGNEVVPVATVDGEKGLPASETIQSGTIQYTYSE